MSTFGQTLAAHPFGPGLRDDDLKLMVASTDIRYRQKLRAVIVQRSVSSREPFKPMSAELIVLNTRENIEMLKIEAHSLDPKGRLMRLAAGDIADVVLESSTTGEKVMITSVGPEDFKSIEQIAHVTQIFIGGHEDRGSWVCRLIDSDRIDALFSGRIIDVSQNQNN